MTKRMRHARRWALGAVIALVRASRAGLASVAVLVVLGAAPAHAWHAGFITVLAVDPASTVYAGTGDGLFKSTDGGTTWTRTGLTGHAEVLAVDPLTPGTLYVSRGYSGYGVLKSTDGGTTWSAAGLAGRTVTALAVDPQTPTTLYAGSLDGVYKSTDGGASWSSAAAVDLLPAFVLALAVDPVTPTTLYAGKEPALYTYDPELYGGGVFKSTDGGVTWGAAGLSGAAIWRVVVDPETPTTLYASMNPNMSLSWEAGVFKSTDGGVTWGGPTGSITVHDLAIDPETPTTLYAATYFGVAKSTDGGATWVAANTGLTDTTLALGLSAEVWAVAVDPLTPTTLYAGTSAGVFTSTDAGETWSPTGLFQHSLTDLSPPTWVDGTLAATGVTSTSVTLTWSGAQDDVAVTGYQLLVDGAPHATPAGPPAAVGGLTPETTYTFKVEACDAAGHCSTTGPSLAVTTPAPPAPDLVVTALSDPPTAARAGRSFAVSDTVANQGSAAAGSSTTRYYLSADAVKGGDGPLTGSRAVPALAAGASSSGTASVTVPAGTPAGTYRVLACADDLGAVAEASETNNCRASAGAVKVR